MIGIGNHNIYQEKTGNEAVKVTEHIITSDDFEIPNMLVCKILGNGFSGFGTVTLVDGNLSSMPM